MRRLASEFAWDAVAAAPGHHSESDDYGLAPTIIRGNRPIANRGRRHFLAILSNRDRWRLFGGRFCERFSVAGL